MEIETGVMRPANETVGGFWKSIFGFPHPDRAKSSRCGFFGVSKQHIYAHEKRFYENILSYVNDHPNPEEGHHLERLWPAIFS